MNHFKPAAVVLTVLVILSSSLSLATEPRRPDCRSAPAALQPVEDCSELRLYVTQALVDSLLGTLYGPPWDLPRSDDGGGGGEPSDYSTTNNQEDGVDELDIVKTDGTHLFVAREESVAILESWPPAETRVVAEVPFGGLDPTPAPRA